MPRTRPLIVLTGPESSGKTTLAEQLSRELALPLVPEIAREYLAGMNGRYTEPDIYRMAILQFRHQQATRLQQPIVLADTDLLTYRIWLEVRFGSAASWLHALHRRSGPVYYLLCRPDLPWQPDPLRENPTDRDDLFERHLDLLQRESWPCAVIQGTGQERTESAWAAIRDLLF